jgi:hypothetical protein
MQRNITEDDFLAWQDHPVSRWVFAAVERAAEAQKAEWERQSWEAGDVSPLVLMELRTRADAYRALFETTFDQWSLMHEPA